MTGDRRRLLVGVMHWIGAGLGLIAAYMLTLDSFAEWDWFTVSKGAIGHVGAGIAALALFFKPEAATETRAKPVTTSPDPVIPTPNDFVFGKGSEKHLSECDPDLVEVHRLALQLSPIDFAIIDGGRTPAEQRANIAKGVSWTMDSRHVETPAKAIDHVPFVEGVEDWSIDAFKLTTDAIKDAARMLDVKCTHGIDWQGKKLDGAHTELDRDVYPYGQDVDVVLNA